MSKKDQNLENSILESAQNLQQNGKVESTKDSILEKEGISQQQFDKELELEKKYGDSPIKAGALALARGASIGLSDVVLAKTGIVDQETLRELDERNKEASIAGEITGTVAPLLFSGGTSLLAKGATKGGAAVLAAEGARKATEKIAAQALKNVLQEKGKQKLYQEIIKKALPKAAGSAVEGTFYGTGKLLSEEALGREELNAQSLAAAVGQSAIIGGTFGGILGSAEALVPIVKNGKVVNYTTKKIKDYTDVDTATWSLVGRKGARLDKIKQTRPEVYNNGKDVIKKAGLEIKDDLGAIEFKLDNFKQSTVKKLDDIYKTADNFQAANPQMMQSGKQLYSEAADNLRVNFIDKFKDVPEVKLGPIKKIIKEYESLASSSNVNDFTAGKLWERQKILDNQLKSMYNKLSAAPTTLEEAISSTRKLINDKLKGTISEIGEATGTDLLEQLERANLDYSTSLELLKDLGKKISKEEQKSFLNFRDDLIFYGGIFAGDPLLGAAGVGVRKFLESDMRRKLTVLGGIEKANQIIGKKIDSSLSNFISGTKKIARPTSLKILTNTSFSLDSKKKPESNKKDAFKSLSNDILSYQVDPTPLIEKLAKNNIRLSQAAPKTTEQVQTTTIRAVQFLASKLPVNSTQTGALDNFLKREWQPSSLELAKFERYLEAIEQPMTVLEDLENGSLTREKVEALQAVYPDLYAKIQETTIDKISKNPEAISYRKRLELGVLLDIPSDTALLPKNIAGLQQRFVDEQQQYSEQQSGSSVNTTLGGLKKLNFAEDAQSESERIANKSK